MSIEEFVRYLTLEKNYSGHTVKAYERDLSVFSDFCVTHFDIQDIDEVAYTQIRSWIVNLSEGGVENRTINRKIASLKAYYKFLQKTGELQVSPLVKHKSLKISKKIQIPFSGIEMENVLREIEYPDGFDGARDRLLIQMLYSTGIRRAELINLKLADVDLHNKTIKVLGKRNKERILPLLDETLALLETYQEQRKLLLCKIEGSFLFLSASGNKLYPNLVYRIINKYFRKVSSKLKTSPHILRHTFATHLLNNGADLNAVKELLGHASLASTQVYTHNSIAELKKVHSASHPRANK